MKKIILLIFSLLAVNAHAGMSSTLATAYGNRNIPVNSYIDVDAEYVAMSITLSSKASDPADRAKRIKELQSSIKTAVSNNQDIEFKQGRITLSSKKKSSSFLSKSSSFSSVNFYLLGKLGEGTDIFDVTQKLHKFIAAIEVPEETSISLGNTTLAMLSPNKYREELLIKVKAEIESTKKIFGPDYKVSVSGLEKPVSVMQKNDRQVTLYIGYRLVFSE